MGTLREDYKDALFDGQRRYQITQNEDGTYTILDATTYTQEGDKFGANDINGTNGAINRLNHVTEVTLLSANWTGTEAPYEQTVEIEGATSDLEPILVRALADGADTTTQEAYDKAFGIIVGGTGTVDDGIGTFKVYKKPATDITVGLKGV